MNAIGKQVKIMRQARVMTQKRLSEEAGVSLPYICQLERGKVNPSIQLIQSIADALECDLQVLLTIKEI